MEEIWKRICDQGGLFEASSHGQIRKMPEGRILPQRLTPSGYVTVSCGAVHRLVLKAFVGMPPTPEHHAAHGNGVRTDNRPENLRWATPKENQADCVLHGTDNRGERNPMAHFTKEIVLEIVRLKGTASAPDVGRKFDTHPTNIKNIWNGRTWSSVTGIPRKPRIPREWVAITVL